VIVIGAEDIVEGLLPRGPLGEALHHPVVRPHPLLIDYVTIAARKHDAPRRPLRVERADCLSVHRGDFEDAVEVHGIGDPRSPIDSGVRIDVRVSTGVDVVRRAHSLTSARVPHQGDLPKVDRATETESEGAGRCLQSAVPAAEELEMLEYQAGAREVQASVFDEGLSRRPQILRPAGRDSAVGVDGYDDVPARSKLLRSVPIAFVAPSDDLSTFR